MIPSALGRLGGIRTVNITSNQTNYNLRTALGSPAGAMRIVVRIASGVTISASNAATPAFDEGNGWAAGTFITIVNAGSIKGAGGGGGSGGDATANISPALYNAVSGQAGVAGGSAIKLTANTAIANSAGEIFGGGGGGGGSGGAWVRYDDVEGFVAAFGGGGGGGGRGNNNAGGASGGNGADQYGFSADGSTGANGSGSAGGTGGAGAPGIGFGFDYTSGAGGTGGDWGAAGTAGAPAPAFPSPTDYSIAAVGSGGAAGKAVDLNGQTLTWISGNDPSRVKGVVS